MPEEAITVFICHSNTFEDHKIIDSEVIPKLELINGIKIVQQNDVPPGTYIVNGIVKILNCTDKALLFISKNFLKSNWCSWELLMCLEKSQRIQRMSIVLLLYDVTIDEVK